MDVCVFSYNKNESSILINVTCIYRKRKLRLLFISRTKSHFISFLFRELDFQR